MGVIGLTPFLLKSFPQVVRTLPERAKHLAGKTLVFDGTLITQRFHFANIPHHYRHIIGWHRVIRELREAGVRAICVFDGSERNVAKQAETERRREQRHLSNGRATIEMERFTRLTSLNAVLTQARSHEGLPAPSPTTPAPPSTLTFTPFGEYAHARATYHEVETDVMTEVLEDNISAVMTQAVGAATDTLSAKLEDPGLLLLQGTSHAKSAYDSLIPACLVSTCEPVAVPRDAGTTVTSHVVKVHVDAPSNTPDLSTCDWSADPSLFSTITNTFSELYEDYQRSIPKIAATLDEGKVTLSHGNGAEPEGVTNAHDQQINSKFQKALTEAEGEIWAEIRGTESSKIDTRVYEQLQRRTFLLLEQSHAMTESYDRRNNPPTMQIYDECREMLDALGVPWIMPDGPYEAEALASSLVVGGHADYVVSEDTDVLVYEAPLVRNMTNRTGPLQIISGADVRSTLGLNRQSYVDWNLLLGTDFSQRLKNVGPIRALKFIREHGTIERVVESEVKYPPRTPVDIYLQQVAVARMVFDTFPPIPKDADFTPRLVDEDRVNRLLQKYGIHDREWEWNQLERGGDNYFGDSPALADGDFAFVPYI